MAGYIGTKAAVVTPGAERKKVFSITTTTTSLTGLAYTPGFVHVFHNGVRLVDGTDYTATNGTSLTLTTAAQNGDEVVVISYATFQTSDTVSASAGGTFSNAVTVNGNLTVDTNTLFVNAANNRVGIGTTSPYAQLHSIGAEGLQLIGASGVTQGVRIGVSATNGGYIEGVDDTLSASYEPLTVGGSLVRFTTANTERLRITSTGSVGIGTSSPLTNLHVRVAALSGYTSVANSGLLIERGNGPAALNIASPNTESGFIWFADQDSSSVGNIAYNHASNFMSFQTNGSERARIDASGNIGLGVTPNAWNVGYKAFESAWGALSFDNAYSGGTVLGANCYIGTASSTDWRYRNTAGATRYYQRDSKHEWYNAPSGTAGNAITFTQAMTLDAGGNLLVGTTAANGNGVTISGTQGNNFWSSKTTSTAGYNQLTFSNPNGIVGFIQTGGSSTIYSTSSDYRLKENVVPLAGAADRLMQIPVCRFNFIADPDKTVDGFLAHEVQAFVPECVTGEKDQVETVEVTDEDGNVTTETRPVYQGIDQSKLVPLLTAALQEALSEIQDLKARVATLEGGAA